MNAKKEPERAPAHLARLLDLIPDAIIVRDLNGLVAGWNLAAASLLGWSREEALGKHANTLLRTLSPQPLESIQADALTAGHWEGDLVHTRRDGTPLLVNSRWAVWQEGDGDPAAIVEICGDATQRVLAERARQLLAAAGPVLDAPLNASGRLANIAQVVVPLLADWCVVRLTDEGRPLLPVAVAHADPEKRALANDLLQSHLANQDAPPGPAQVLKTGEPKLYPEASEELLAAIARDADQLELVRSLGVKSAMIVPLVTRGHTLGTITLVVSAESGRQYAQVDLALAEELARRAAVAVDNARLYAESQRLNAELEERVARRTFALRAAVEQLENSRAQLLRLTQHEQLQREADRARMAREVHDELGQAMTGLKMDLAWLQKHTKSGQRGLLHKYQDMTELVDSTIKGVRRIATELRPGMLDDLGLVPAMEWQLQEFQKRSGIKCGFASSVEEVALKAEDATTLFRILQETLTNVARHASASAVDVTLDEVQGYVRLRVQDNGRGITESEMVGSKSFGLLGIRERVNMRSGEFSIHGAPGEGTTVEIRLPATKPQEAK